MAKKKKDPKKPKVHKDLDGFDVSVNKFGEIQTPFDLDKLNDFLNKNVEDKKLRNLKDDEKEEKK
jgi:hypothetical protein